MTSGWTSSPVRQPLVPDGWASAAVLLLLAALLVGRFGYVAYEHLRDPHDLVLETPTFAPVQLIRAGENPYAAAEDFPYVVCMYSPLYLVAAAAVPTPAEMPFLGGRLISLVSTLLAAAAIGLTIPRGRGWMVWIIGAGTFLALWPVLANAVYFKTDLLAVALAAGALGVVVRWPASAGAAMVAALLSCGALATKQSFIAAPLAITGWLLLTNWRHLALFLGTFLAVGGLLVGIAWSAWGDAFLWSLFYAPVPSWSGSQFLESAGGAFSQPLLVALFALTVGLLAERFSRLGSRVVTESPLLFYLAATAIVLVATLGKVGSYTNYFIEIALAQILWLAAVWPDLKAKWPKLAVWVKQYAVCFLALEMMLYTPHSYLLTRQARIDDQIETYGQFRDTVEEVRISSGPVINLSQSAHGPNPAGVIAFNDSLAFYLLWSHGRLSPEPFLRDLKDHRFGVIMVLPRNQLSLGSNPALARIMRELPQHYRLAKHGEHYDYYVPRTE